MFVRRAAVFATLVVGSAGLSLAGSANAQQEMEVTTRRGAAEGSGRTSD